jgi:glyoxylase-like metal-dependent hydrolase (beta-lactamase superfamily II)
MLFRQIIHEDLGCASYLVADREAGVAAVVDPQWDVEPYRRLARLHGVRIGHVLETHNHADHVSGHGRLARTTGATIHIHELAGAEYAHESFADGWVLELGDLTIEAVHTPGHRPEHTSFLLRDASRGGAPWALLGGDSLFIGDVARPDLAVEPREGAAAMFRSLHERLLTLDDEVEVWPALRWLRDRPQDLLDDRLRASPQPRPRDRRRRRVRHRRGLLARRPPAQRRADRRPQPRPAGR